MHHVIEALFKGFGVILDRATIIDERRQGASSFDEGSVVALTQLFDSQHLLNVGSS